MDDESEMDDHFGIRKLNIRRVQSATELLYDLVNENWPQSPLNARVQEIGNEFFEEFGKALQSYNNFKERCSDQVKLFKRESRSVDPATLGFNPNDMILDKEDYENLYMEALYTIKHRIGRTDEKHVAKVNELMHYAQRAFKITDREHSRLLKRSVEAKPPVVVLEVLVAEARNLMAKDADGFSDPYCMLGIVPANVGSKLLSHMTSIDKSKLTVTAADMIPAKFIKSTSVKFNTLQPVWNEKFRFDLENVQMDKLHLDVWDRDDDFSVVDSAKKLNEVKGIKGLGRYFKQIAQSARTNNDDSVDDFMGTIELPLGNIPSTGLNQWFDLTSRSTKSKVQGQIRLELNLATREDRWRDGDEEEELAELREHKNLMRVFIEHEYNVAKENGEEWDGELCREARTILHQHAIQGDISEVRQAICWWLAMAHQYCRKLFPTTCLLSSLNNLELKWQQASLYREDEEILGQSFKQCCAFLLKLIDHKIELSTEMAVDVNGVKTALLCLLKLHESSLFQRCLPFQPTLKLEVIGLIKDIYTSSYNHLRGCKNISADEQDLVKRYTHIIRNIIITIVIGKDVYNSLFISTTEVDFFRVAYKKSYNLLSSDLPRDLDELLSQNRDDWDKVGYNDDDYNTCIPIFKLFLVIRRFFNLSRYLDESDRRNLPSLNYNEAFKPYLNHWVHIVDCLLTRRLEFLNQLEKVEKIGGDVVQSSLAVDVAYCFGQVVNFWLNLRWPDVDGSLARRFVKIINDGALEIFEMITSKLAKAGYYDEVGQFDISEELCITINNMEQVKKAYGVAVSAFIQSENEWDTKEEKHQKDSRNRSVVEMMENTDNVLNEHLKQVADKVADKMRPDIKRFVFHLCWAPEAASHQESITNLMNYLDGNLSTVNECLLKANFERILESIWIEVLEEIDSIITVSIEEISDGAWIPKRLHQSMNVLVDFFHAGGKGLATKALKCQLYQSVIGKLEAMLMTVHELINEFYKQKLLLQSKQDQSKNGYITVRAYYNAGSVFVEVINAKNLSPMDANGLSDPFVIVELGPRFLFGKTVHRGQTKIVKRSLNPTFNDTFTFEVPEALCRSQSASVVFTLMDHDLLSSNDFAGEAYLSLNQLPGINSSWKSKQSSSATSSSSSPHSSSSSSPPPTTTIRNNDDDNDPQNSRDHHQHRQQQLQHSRPPGSALIPITLSLMQGTETTCWRLVTILNALKMRKDQPIVQDFLQRKADTVPRPD